MRRVRVIPVLLLSENGMIKTQRFSKARYLGDPINAVKIFNDKQVDELILLDIQATRKGRVDFEWVEDIVSEAFMPIAYGGGITSVNQCVELFTRGVEKIIVNTAACERPHIISEVADRFGSQAVVVSIDARRNWWKQNRAYIRGGSRETRRTPVDLARRAEELGAGEIFLTAIDREGTFGGYDISTLRSVSDAVRLPVIANGGAGSLEHFRQAVAEGGASAVAAGSMFVFAAKGEGMLISYPPESELKEHVWTRVC